VLASTSLTRGTAATKQPEGPGASASSDNECVGRVGDWRSQWAVTARRVLAAPQAPGVAGGSLGLLAVAETIARTGSVSATVGLPVALLLCLFTTLPVAGLRAQPVAAAVAISAASVLSLTAFQTMTIAGLIAQLTVLYWLARSGSQLLAVSLALPFLVVALADLALHEDGVSLILTVLLASLGPVAASAGAARQARTESAEHSAAQQVIVGSLLEHSARGERARIVRELHDVVAHHISMIAVQAETARLATHGMPAAGAQRLSAIGDTARAALTEMRRLLGVLREDTEAGAVNRQPQPGLQQLNELLDEARDASGTATRLIVSGAVTVLDPGVELVAYRIVQEALTNARRHAPGAAVDVEVHYADDALGLRIRDTGPGPPPAGLVGGHGLLGMRERTAAVGGTLLIGAAAGGGFLVEAWLPAKAARFS
jgi:signal transduction histidine kinase